MGTTVLQSLQETDEYPLSCRETREVLGMTGQDQGLRLLVGGRLEEGGATPKHSCIVDGQQLPGAAIK